MPAKERHRNTLACARCYQMKKKCDKKVPSCSRCLFARQPCIGINRQKAVEVPRSIVRYLEQLLSESENASTRSSVSIARVTDQHRRHNSEVLSPRMEPSSASHYSYVIQAGIASINGQFTTSLLQARSVLHHNSRLFYGSERPPLKIYVGVHQEEPYRIPVMFSFLDKINTDPLKVPIGVAKLLLNVYIENVLPRYPCFFETDLQEHFNAVYQDPIIDRKTPLASSKFIILMVLAISSLTSKAHGFRKVASLSESLHRDALRHSHFLRNADVTSLQCFFLLLQLALLLPSTGNLWYMSGEAMRMAISLGLHQELREPINFRMTDLRRRLFWLAYTFERTIAITSGCPLAISDEHINVNLPSEYEDACLGIDGLDFSQPHRRKKTQFVNHVLFRRLQTKVHVVQFLGHKLTGSATNYDEWVCSLEMEIKIWQDQAFAVNENPPDWFTNAVRHTQLMLYRPCSRNPIPSHSSIKSALDAAVGICNGSWKLCQTGYLIFPFHNVYNVFQAGLVMLYALQHHSDIVHANCLHSEIMEALSLTPQIFATLAVRWPAAVDTGHYFNELKESILQNLESVPEADDSGESINLLAELDHFVTQRRIRGFNYRNIYPTNALTIPDPISPEWAEVPSALDESWEDFLNMELNFQNVDSLDLVCGVESENSHNLIPDPSPGPTGRNNCLPSISSLTSVIESLPACNYCRNRRVKCNRSLPSCSTCTSYGKQCLYYDAILEQDIQRSYVHSLYIKIKSLIAAEPESLPVDNDINPIPATQVVANMPNFARNIFLPFPKSTGNTTIKETSMTHDFRSLGSIFFGPSNSLAVCDYTLSTSSKFSQVHQVPANDIIVSDLILDHGVPDQEVEVILPPFSVAEELVNLFMRSVNIFYPTLQLHAMDDMLSKAYNDPEGFRDSFEERIFYLVIAIASQLTKSYNVNLAFTPSAYFKIGTSDLSSTQEKMNKSQLLFLQKSLLICIYLLFSPGSGDIWRNCGFSVRLYFDMIHRPPDDDDLDQPLAIILYRTLHCLECQVAITYGRPTLLSISDTLRDNLMTSISHTVPEQVSIHFYKSSFIKLQILNDILSTPAAGENPTPDIRSRIQAHEEALESWFEEWEKDFQTFTAAESQDQNCFLAPLRAWGNVIYCETLLLLSQTKPLPTEKENLQLCDRFVNACTTLTRHQRNSAPLCQISEIDSRIVIDGVPLIFPITWTTTHAVFSAALSLFSEQNQQKRSTADSVARGSTIRRSIMLLAHLGADPNNLSYGFSEIIEQLYISEEMSRG